MPALRSGDLTFTTLVGPATTDDGAPVLCLHGFPDAPSTYGSLLATLGSAGFSAYAPTLRGYEPSSQPADGDYSLIALASDVVGCLDDRGPIVGQLLDGLTHLHGLDPRAR